MMCSVVGYIGKNLCASSIIEGLSRLEYRGYDSAGLACLDSIRNNISCVKASGALSFMISLLEQKPIDGFVGIGHTRWSTHGDFSVANAHPQLDCAKTLSVVHNGIIENYLELKKELLSFGHTFSSDTDTEVIPHLFEQNCKKYRDLVSIVVSVVDALQGAYACVVLAQQWPDVLIAIRRRSPLCIGVGDDEMFIASDVIAFAEKTNNVVFLPDESFALVYRDHIKLFDFEGNDVGYTIQQLSKSFFAFDKGEYPHFMLKEIFEQKEAIRRTVNACAALGDDFFSQIGFSREQIKACKRICFIACGTSWHAALLAQFFFEDICGIPVDVKVASEFRYAQFFYEKDILYVALSQSGETADVLEAVRLIKFHGGTVLAVTNSPLSSLMRESAGFLMTHAGVEVAVAATKSFSTQLAVLYWFAHYCAYIREKVSYNDVYKAEQDLVQAAVFLESLLNQYKHEITLLHAPEYSASNGVLFVGRHSSYPLALEAALKLKEIAYIFAESYSAGELKHGALALVDKTVPVYFFSHQDDLIYRKLLSNAHEIKCRGGRLIVFAYAGQDELISLADTVFVCPADVPQNLGPIAMVGLAQFLAYAIALERGCPIDKPRNLAKSVTVE